MEAAKAAETAEVSEVGMAAAAMAEVAEVETASGHGRWIYSDRGRPPVRRAIREPTRAARRKNAHRYSMHESCTPSQWTTVHTG